jgi:lipopolysaccharide heptosyltransferase II
MADIQKILVIRLSSIGDIILTTPLLRSLRTTYPTAHISFVIKKQYADLLAGSPFVNELILFDKKEGFVGLRKMKHRLRERRFDVYIDIHKNWRSRYLRMGLGVKLATTYPKYIFRRTLLVWFKLNLYKKLKPVYLRYFESVRKLGIQDDGQGTEIHVQSPAIGKVRNMLIEAGFGFNAPLVIICPAATYSNKRWKAAGFVETARALILQRSAFIVVLGGKEDVDLCREITESFQTGAVSMAGRLSLSESAALLRFAGLVIANDSGLLHLAQSQKKPVIGIYGPTTRELGFFPIDQQSTVIEVELPCRPCTPKGLNYCPKKHFRCMNSIPADRVIQAALSYLD